MQLTAAPPVATALPTFGANNRPLGFPVGHSLAETSKLEAGSSAWSTSLRSNLIVTGTKSTHATRDAAIAAAKAGSHGSLPGLAVAQSLFGWDVLHTGVVVNETRFGKDGTRVAGLVHEQPPVFNLLIAATFTKDDALYGHDQTLVLVDGDTVFVPYHDGTRLQPRFVPPAFAEAGGSLRDYV